MDTTDKKQCKMCCMEIPAGAKKCPYCQYFQKTFAILWFHPAVWAVILLLVFVGIADYFAGTMFHRGESYAKHVGQVSVLEPKMQFGENQHGPTVIILGKARNDSPLGWKEVVFHVDFFDADGNLVDMTQEKKYSYIIPAGKTQSFKVSFQRQFPAEKYVKYEISIISAQEEGTLF